MPIEITSEPFVPQSKKKEPKQVTFTPFTPGEKTSSLNKLDKEKGLQKDGIVVTLQNQVEQKDKTISHLRAKIESLQEALEDARKQTLMAKDQALEAKDQSFRAAYQLIEKSEIIYQLKLEKASIGDILKNETTDSPK